MNISSVEKENVTLTASGNFTAKGPATVWKIGNIVFLHLNFSYSGSPSYSTQAMATGLPSKYRPSDSRYMPIVGYASNSPYVYTSRIQVTSGGDLLIGETSMPSGSSIPCMICYPL